MDPFRRTHAFAFEHGLSLRQSKREPFRISPTNRAIAHDVGGNALLPQLPLTVRLIRLGVEDHGTGGADALHDDLPRAPIHGLPHARELGQARSKLRCGWCDMNLSVGSREIDCADRGPDEYDRADD